MSFRCSQSLLVSEFASYKINESVTPGVQVNSCDGTDRSDVLLLKPHRFQQD